MAGTERAWTVVVPVKRLDRAKTRLTGHSAAERQELALAFARDVVAAAVATPSVAAVVVVTDDGRAATALSAGDRVRVVPDRPDAGLNPALEYAAGLADPALGVVAMSSDLPAADPDALARLLGGIRDGERAFLADARGVGTTVLAAAAGLELQPVFGPRSRARHARSGARDLLLPDMARLRRDVDTDVDLWDAVRLGVGTATAAVLRRSAGSTATAQSTTRQAMATCLTYVPGAGGTVVLDDGTRAPFAAAALDPAVRSLRPGQRVRTRMQPDETGIGRVVALTVAGFALPAG